MAKSKRSARAKGKAVAKAPRRGGLHYVRNTETGLVHQVTAEQARYLTSQREVTTGRVLFDAASGPDHGEPDLVGAVVSEAAYGVPDDAITTDAIAMAERGGQPKGTIAGPTIPQEARTDRGNRADGPHPLAKGSYGEAKPPAGSVRADVAARHKASMNLPEHQPGQVPVESEVDEAEALNALNEEE
jgi:hypothetical protein